MKNILNQEVDGLYVGQLIDLLLERKEGYLKASEKMLDPYLKQLFLSNSEITNSIMQEIYKISENEYLSDNIYEWKSWIDTKEAIVWEERTQLLEACIKGEQNLIYFYMDLIKSDHIPSELKEILQRQLSQIKSACDLLKVFKISL